MAEGGTLPWKVQRIDESRGPAGDYSAVHRPLPDPPEGVEWQKDAQTGEWNLVRTFEETKEKARYSLKVGEAWDVAAGRAAPTLVPVPIEQRGEQKEREITVAGLTDAAGGGSAGSDTSTSKEEHEKEKEEEERPAIEGKHYLIHTIVPTDTFSGLCLRYRIKPHVLRRTNRFSGSNLRLAPHNLIIPLGPNGEGLNGGAVRAQDTNCPEFKLHALQGAFPSLRHAECKAYLELANWDLDEAKKAAADDDAWERQEEQKRAREEDEAKRLAEEREKRNRIDVHIAVPAEAPTVEGEGGLTEPLLQKVALRKLELPCIT